MQREHERRRGLNFGPLLVILLATILTYLPYFKNTFGIDTSTMLLNQRQMLDGYLSQGRFGIVWIFELFIRHYHNAVVPFVAIALLIGAGIYLFYLLQKLDQGAKTGATLLFVLIFINNPVIYAQLYFKLQAIEIVLGLILVLMALDLASSRLALGWRMVGAGLLLALAISIYQTFVFLAFSLILFGLLISPERRRELALVLFTALGLGSLIYGLIYKIYALKVHFSSYGATNYFLWDKLLARFALYNALHKLVVVGFVLLALVYVSVLIFALARRKTVNQDWLLVLLLLGSFFTFNLVFGNPTPTPRVYFGTFSVIVAGLFYHYQKHSRFLGKLMLLVSLFLMAATLKIEVKANQSFVTDQEMSQMVVTELRENGVSQAQEGDYRVIFIGNLQSDSQGIVKKVEDVFITGATRSSFFQFEDSSIVNLSQRPYDFMKLQGHNFQVPDPAVRQKVAAENANLPNYPAKNSVKFDRKSKMLIIKLSNLTEMKSAD